MSGLAITQEGSEEREYCLLHYLRQNDNESYEVDFVIAWNTKTHLNVSIYTNTLNITYGINGSIVMQSVEEDYKHNHYQLVLDLPLEFESDAIRIDIPMIGISFEGWKMIPLTPPIVSIIYLM